MHGLLFVNGHTLFVDCIQLASRFSRKLGRSLLDFSFRIDGSSRGGLALHFFSRSVLFLFQKSMVFVIGFFFVVKSLKLIITALNKSLDFIEGGLLLIRLANRGPEFHTRASQR